jgi:hypothetical protein
MTDSFKREIERLLDEPGELPGADRASKRLRSRLSATLSEGLGDVSAAPSDFDATDFASIAAFVDGRLTSGAHDKFANALVQQHGLRADVESAAELVHSISESSLEVPKDLLARAGAQFAPAAPRPTESRSRWNFSLSALLPRQRMALAMVAALVAVLAVPAGLMIGGRFGVSGGGGEPELSAVSEPDVDAQRKACKEKEKADAAKAEKLKPAVPVSKEAADKSKAKDPCDQFAPSGEKSK